MVKQGLTSITATILLLGVVLGVGILSFPLAFRLIGWPAIALLISLCCCYAFSGITLAKCWIIVREEFPGYKIDCSKPYPVVGEKAFGTFGRITVELSLYVTIIGSCVVQILIAAENTMHLFSSINVNLSFCVWIILVSGVTLPCCWLRSPKKLWQITLVSVATTVFACGLIVAQSLIDLSNKEDNEKSKFSDQNKTVSSTDTPFYESFFTSFSIMMYGMYSMSVYPTVQVDMESPNHFHRAVVSSMSVALFVYTSVASIGYQSFGNTVNDNILTSLANGWMHFGWKRVCVRTFVNAAIVFIAMSIPGFGKVMGLIGGSTMPLLAFVFPSVFYTKLSSQYSNKVTRFSGEFFAILFVASVGLLGAAAGTFVGVKSVLEFWKFTRPCYITN